MSTLDLTTNVFEVKTAHDFIRQIDCHYQTKNIKLNPVVRNTLSSMVTAIYDDLKYITDVEIEMTIFATEDLAPSIFSCKLKSGECSLIINITNDGKKTSRFERMTWKSDCSRLFKPNANAVFSFLKSLIKPTICAVILASMGYTSKGPADLTMCTSLGFFAPDKVIEKLWCSFEKKYIQANEKKN